MTAPPFIEWCQTAQDAAFSDPDECAVRASKFERRIKRRNAIEYGVGAVMVLLFAGVSAAAMWRGDLMIGLAALLIVLGIAVMLRNLAKRASNLDRRPEDPCVVHLKRQYAHQRAALQAVPVWYLGPLVPGLLAFYLAVTKRVADVIGWGAALKGSAGTLAAFVAVFVGIAIINLIVARYLERQIEELDALS